MGRDRKGNGWALALVPRDRARMGTEITGISLGFEVEVALGRRGGPLYLDRSDRQHGEFRVGLENWQGGVRISKGGITGSIRGSAPPHPLVVGGPALEARYISLAKLSFFSACYDEPFRGLNQKTIVIQPTFLQRFNHFGSN